jgi:uncharacterized membrane protein
MLGWSLACGIALSKLDATSNRADFSQELMNNCRISFWKLSAISKLATFSQALMQTMRLVVLGHCLNCGVSLGLLAETSLRLSSFDMRLGCLHAESSKAS